MTDLATKFAALVERVARALAIADGIEICSDATYAHSHYGIRAKAVLADPEILRALEAKEKIVGWLRESSAAQHRGGQHEAGDLLSAVANDIENNAHLKGTDHAD